MPTQKFNPKQLGFVQTEGHSHRFTFPSPDKNEKRPLAILVFHEYENRQEWMGYRVKHFTDGTDHANFVFYGTIPTNAFAKQLFKNIFPEWKHKP